jgi:RNA polymerase sigma factor (sigma-70 family)
MCVAMSRVGGIENESSAAAAEKRFRDLLDRYGALLRRAIARACPKGRGVSCDDIQQEALISLWKALKSEREIAAPASYVYKVAVSATIRALRRARSLHEEPVGDEDASVGRRCLSSALQTSAAESPWALVERAELRQKIGQALAQLAENRRRVVHLHLRGLTTTEIGALLGWTEAKARNLVYRGLEDLRRALRASGVNTSHGCERRRSASRLAAAPHSAAARPTRVSHRRRLGSRAVERSDRGGAHVRC